MTKNNCLVKLDQFPYDRPLATKKSECGGLLVIAIYCLLAFTFISECIKWTDTRYSSKSSTVELDGRSLASVTDGLSVEVRANGEPFYDPRYFSVQFAANRIEPRDNVTGKRARSKVYFEAVPCNDGRHMCPGEPTEPQTTGIDDPSGIQGTYFSKHGFQFFTVELRPCYKSFPSNITNVTVPNATGNMTLSDTVSDHVHEVVENSHCVTKEGLDAWLMEEGNYVTVSLQFDNHLTWMYHKLGSVYLNLEPGIWQGVETHFTLTEYKVADNILADETKPCRPAPSLQTQDNTTGNGTNSSDTDFWEYFEPHCGNFLTYSGKDIRRSAGNRLVKFYLKLDGHMKDEVLIPNSLGAIVFTLMMLFMAAHQGVGSLGQYFAKKCGVVVPTDDDDDKHNSPYDDDKHNSPYTV